jgi:ribosomal-protein-alanine N-acetyltransferase
MTRLDTPRLEVAGPETAALLADIHAQAFDTPWSTEQLARSLDGPGAFAVMALSGQRAQGFVIARAMAGEAEVITLAVRPADRRKGVGRTLMDAAVATAVALGATVMWLEAAVDNQAAVALYQSMRFETTGRRKRYYARGDGPRIDALIMRRELNTARS